MKSKLRGLRFARLRLLLVALIVLSTGLLVINLVELIGRTQDAEAAAGRYSTQIISTVALHLLTLLAVWAVWFSLRAREADQRRLRRSEQKHRSIINHAGEAIFLLDSAGRIQEWNKMAEQLFGAARRSVLGLPLRDVHLCYGLELDRAIADALRLSRSLTFEFPWRRAQRPDGLITLTLSPLPPGRGSGDLEERLFVVIARDVTSERQLESRMSQAEKLAGIGQLAAGIAHQLNTPLGSILLSAQMLAESEPSEDQLEDVERILRQTEQCRQIIKGLLNFARPQSRERSLVPLGEVVHETVYLMEKSLRVAGVKVDLETTGPLEIAGNRHELEQVFFNLLVNAVDAMPDGGTVTIRLGPGGPGEILASVADTGPGIQPAQRDEIFLPFFTTKDYGKGTGLGLSIVARIMHEHGGRIELDPAYASGARFLLSFPQPGLGLTSSESEVVRPTRAPAPDPHEPVRPDPTEPRA
jgi:two-component system, NtrC family, sensor kinase